MVLGMGMGMVGIVMGRIEGGHMTRQGMEPHTMLHGSKNRAWSGIVNQILISGEGICTLKDKIIIKQKILYIIYILI